MFYIIYKVNLINNFTCLYAKKKKLTCKVRKTFLNNIYQYIESIYNFSGGILNFFPQMNKEYNPVLLSKDRYYRDRSAEKVNKII